MPSVINNASPQVLNLGTDDQSKKTVYATSEPLPQHLPKFYILGQKGDGSKGNIVSASKLAMLVGDATLDQNDKYHNHATNSR